MMNAVYLVSEEFTGRPEAAFSSWEGAIQYCKGSVYQSDKLVCSEIEENAYTFFGIPYSADRIGEGIDDGKGSRPVYYIRLLRVAD